MKYLNIILIIITTLLTSCGNDPIESFNKAVAHADANQWKEAKELAADVVDELPTPLTEAFYALCLNHQAKNTEGQAILKRLATDHASDATIQFLCGHAYLESGDLANAYIYLKNAYKLEPKNQDCLLDLFKVTTSLNKLDAPSYFNKLKVSDAYANHSAIYNNSGVWWNKKSPSHSYKYFVVADSKKDRSNRIILNKAINLDQRAMYNLALINYKKYQDSSSTTSSSKEAMAVSIRAQQITEYLNNK